MTFPSTVFVPGTTITHEWLNAVNAVCNNAQGYVSVTSFGAVGDGVTDDSAALQAALDTGKSVFIPAGTFYFASTIYFKADNQSIIGAGNTSILKSAIGSVYINTAGYNNLTFNNFKLDASDGTNGGLVINSGSNNIKIINIYFYEGNQRVWLFTATNVLVSQCTFDSTGYGIIQEYGYVSNNVIVDSNHAYNLYNDFVEANCGASAPSEMWTVTNNIYDTSNSYPTPAVETRFVGITSVRNVIISNNNVQKTSGDAAIHLEDTLGDTIISNNIFDNCIGAAGNDGYIYILNSAENTVITGNTFLRTNSALGTASAISTSSNFYTANLVISSNRIEGVSGSSNFKGLELYGNGGYITITNNLFSNLDYAVSFGSAAGTNFEISGNSVSNVNYGYYTAGTLGLTGGGGENMLFSGNLFTNVTSYDIALGQNTNGTTPAKKITLNGNVFAKNVLIRSTAGVNNCEDITVTNNVFKAGATLTGLSYVTRLVNILNTFNDYGYAISSLSNFANDVAASAGGVPIGGMYRNGSVVQIRVS